MKSRSPGCVGSAASADQRTFSVLRDCSTCLVTFWMRRQRRSVDQARWLSPLARRTMLDNTLTLVTLCIETSGMDGFRRTESRVAGGFRQGPQGLLDRVAGGVLFAHRQFVDAELFDEHRR